MKSLGVILFLSLSSLWAQYRVDISPFLCPYYRAGVPTLFRLDIQDLSGKPLPSQGEIHLVLNLNGFIFSKTLHLEAYALQKYFVFEVLSPPKLAKGNDFHLSLSGALNHQESLPSNTFLSSTPVKKKLSGIFHSSPSRQEWWRTFLAPLASQICPLSFPPELLSDFRFLDHFDFLIWEKSSVSQNTSELLKIVRSWILSGGVLLLTEKTVDDVATFFQLPSAEIFSLGKTLGEEEQWQKFQIDPHQEVFWNQQHPFLIALNYGAGKILLLNESTLPNSSDFFKEPFWNRKLPSVFAPESFLPFQHYLSTPPLFQGVLLVLTCLYPILLFLARKKKKLKQGLIFSFSVLIFGVYWMWGTIPVVTQEVRIFWISFRGQSWQRLVHYRSSRLAQMEISSHISESPLKTSLILPQFYENRDFEYPDQRAQKTLTSNPEWHVQWLEKKISRVPLVPPGSAVWEQRGTLDPLVSSLLREPSENKEIPPQLRNPTEIDFRFVFLFQDGKWGFLESLPAGAHHRIIWLQSLEEGIQKLPLPYQRLVSYLAQVTEFRSSKWIAFPASSPEVFRPSGLFDFSAISVYVSLD